LSLPLDSDGFLRRECPNCERQFKWLHTPNAAPVDGYFCPYCHEPAPAGSWWTKPQLNYAKQLAASEVLGPGLRKFQQQLESLNQPGSLVRFEASGTLPEKPKPLTEPDDMVRCDVPCHREEPFKVDEAWDGEVACLICGIRYPLELVRGEL
jgi:hypothetical protein